MERQQILYDPATREALEALKNDREHGKAARSLLARLEPIASVAARQSITEPSNHGNPFPGVGFRF